MSELKENKMVSRQELIDRIVNNLNKKGFVINELPTNIIGCIINELLKEVQKIMVNGEEIVCPGYFALGSRIIEERKMIGEDIQTRIIPVKRVPKIKFFNRLKNRITDDL